MKGLRKYLSPFTPDQSGATDVLYGYGGIVIILDAGGCTGNVCGFDEPRWYLERSAVFSAGLRDMDAILGRDELLIKKTMAALSEVDATFVGFVGTPVPAVIGTDYRGLCRLMEKECKLPVVAVQTNGMDLYDKGQELAYVELIEKFGQRGAESNYDAVVLGASAPDMLFYENGEALAERLKGALGCEAPLTIGYGELGDLAQVANAGSAVVVSPSGLRPARLLRDEYGIEYRCEYPLQDEVIEQVAAAVPAGAKHILVVHQQVLACELRKRLQVKLGAETDIGVASWFMMDDELMVAGDVHLSEEEDLFELVKDEGYDVVIGDPLFKRTMPGFGGTYISLPHFAVSGSLYQSHGLQELLDKIEVI